MQRDDFYHFYLNVKLCIKSDYSLLNFIIFLDVVFFNSKFFKVNWLSLSCLNVAATLRCTRFFGYLIGSMSH